MKRFAMVAAAALAFATAGARAQEARSGGGASAELVQQLQQLASERTDLQAQVTKLQQSLEDMRKQRDALKAGQAGADRRAAQSEAAVRQVQQQAAERQKAADDNVARWRQQMDELVAKFRELAQTLRATETDRNALQQQLAAQRRAVGVCTDANAGLYNLNTELLQHLEHPGLGSLFRAEPFTQIARTRLENTALEYKQRAEQLRLQAAHAKEAGHSGT